MSSPALPRSPASINPMRQQLDELDALLQRMLSLPVNTLENSGGVAVAEAPEPPARGEKSRDRPVTPPERIDKPFAPFIERVSIPQQPTPGDKGEARAPRIDKEAVAKDRHEATPKPLGPYLAFQPISNPGTLTVTPMPPATETADERKSPLVVKPMPATPLPTTSTAKTSGWGPFFEKASPGVVEEPAALEEDLPELPELRSPFLERHQARLRERHEVSLWLRPLVWVNRSFDRCAIAVGGPGLWLVRPQARTAMGWIGILLLLAAAGLAALDWFGWTW